MSETVTLTRAEAEQMILTALTASGTNRENAEPVARALVAAEIDGQAGHGFSRVSSYCAQAKSGKVNGVATPTVTHPAAGFVAIDADGGFAYRAMELAINNLAEAAANNGVAAAGIANSHHCGQAGLHVEALADRGCVALLFANTPKAMAPWGGDAPLFGTNPIAFAAPRKDTAPVVIDLSLSKVARGKIMAAGKRGGAIPEGWALDDQGRGTTDPKAALAGSMIPMGDAKGAALAMMVEIMAVCLTGANFSFEATSFFDADGARPGVGQLLIAFDVNKIAGGGFQARMGALTAAIEAQAGARLPGSKRLKNRVTAEAEGITVSVALVEEIRALGSS